MSNSCLITWADCDTALPTHLFPFPGSAAGEAAVIAASSDTVPAIAAHHRGRRGLVELRAPAGKLGALATRTRPDVFLVEALLLTRCTYVCHRARAVEAQRNACRFGG